MINKVFILIFFVLFIQYHFIFAQAPTKQDLEEQYGSIQNVPEESVKQSTQEDNIVIKNVNQTYYSKTVTADGYTQAILTGNVHIVYDGKDIYSDEMIIRFIAGKAKILIAKGNVLLKQKDRSTIARQIYVYLEAKNIQLLDPITLQNNYYVRGLGIRYNSKDLLHLEDVSMTTSTRYFPRYSLNASSGWVEQDNDLVLLNAYIKVGQDPIFYFPVFYNNHYGTGMITNLSFDAYLGFMIYNTLKQSTPVSNEEFMLDYYQKLGLYVGNNYSRTDIGTLDTHIGFAYDYHAKINNGFVENVFEQILGEGPSIGRSLRYNIDISYDVDLLKAKDANGLNIKYKGAYKELSDPDFITQFEQNRLSQFDIKGLLFPDNKGSDKVQSGTGYHNTEGRRIDNSIILGMNGYNLQITTSLAYNLNSQENLEKVNTFSPEFWKNSPSKQIFPQIDFNKSFAIYTVNHKFANNSNITMPIKLDVSYTLANTSDFEAEGLSKKSLSNSLKTYISSFFTYSTESLFKLYIPFSIENYLKYNNNQEYLYKEESQLDFRTGILDNSTTMNYSPELTFQILDNLSFVGTSTFNTIYQKMITSTENPTDKQQNNDNNNTFDNVTQKLGETLKIQWSNDWDYLNGYVEGSYVYSSTNKFGALLPSTLGGKSTEHSAAVTMNFFLTTLGISSLNKYGSKLTKEEEMDPLSISVESTAIPGMVMKNIYTWDRYYEKPLDNTFSLEASIPSRLNIWSWLWFSSIDININLSSDFVNPMLDYLNYKFGLVFNITSLWQIEFYLQGNNKSLYLYGDSVPEGRRKNFFIDLFQSFALWSTRLRQESAFKMQSLGITLSHDLDEWVLKAGASLEPVARSGSFYFDTQFYIEVILKDLGMLSAPKMSQGSDNEEYY